MSLANELKTLKELHEKGILTDQEYADAKAGPLEEREPANEHRARLLFISWQVKALLVVLLIFLGFVCVLP